MSKIKLIGISIIVFFAALIIASEVIFEKEQVIHGNYIWEPGFSAILNPDQGVLKGLDDSAHFSINKIGIRTTSREKNQCDLKILLIGGSTTECFYLDDKKTWGAHLDSLFGKRHWIGNLGKSGLNMEHHILTLQKGLDQYDKIDYILFLVGINDLINDLNQSQNIKIDQRSPFDQTFMRAENKSLNFFENLVLVKRLRILIQNIRYSIKSKGKVQTITGSNYQKWRRHRNNSKFIVDTLPNLTFELEEYEKNIEELILLCREKDITPVFLTQPALYSAQPTIEIKNLCWLGGLGNFQVNPDCTYYSISVLHQLLGDYNRILVNSCNRLDEQCIDLADAIPPDPKYFYDDCHFTNHGARRVAIEIFKLLKSIDD